MGKRGTRGRLREEGGWWNVNCGGTLNGDSTVLEGKREKERSYIEI